MSLQAMFDSCPDAVSMHGGFGLDWSLKGCGFGQLYFDVKEGEIYCDSEYMSPESVKKILGILVDQAKFRDFKELKGVELTKEKLMELREERIANENPTCNE